MSNKFVIIEGNIGAGKSTLIDNLSKSHEGSSRVDEPYAEWEKVGTIQAVYNDPKKYSFESQIHFIATRLINFHKIVEKAKSGSTIFSDRSGYSDRYCFMKIAVDNGNLTPMQIKIYDSFYHTLMKIYEVINSENTTVLYIDTSPELCLQRIKERDRECESYIPLEYLKKLDYYHKTELIPFYKKNNIKVIQINGETNFKDSMKVVAGITQMMTSI